MSDTLSYDQCSLNELYQVLNTIDAKKHPENFAALDAEIRSRQGASYADLLECWSLLKRGLWPEHEAYLAAEIESARRKEGMSRDAPLAHLRYKTFWRRVLAAFLDGALFVIPISLTTIAFVNMGRDFDQTYEDVTYFFNILFVIYSVAMHASFGQTVGKMLANVKVVTVLDESDIRFRHALLRDIVPVAGLILSLVGIVWDTLIPSGPVTTSFALAALWLIVLVLFWPVAEIITMLLNKKRRAIHDYIAGTVVIRV